MVSLVTGTVATRTLRITYSENFRKTILLMEINCRIKCFITDAILKDIFEKYIHAEYNLFGGAGIRSINVYLNKERGKRKASEDKECCWSC